MLNWLFAKIYFLILLIDATGMTLYFI